MATENEAGSEFEQRIAAFTGQLSKAQQGNAALTQTVQTLQAQNQILEQRINDALLSQRQPVPTTPVSSGSPDSFLQEGTAKAQSGDIQAMVAGLVETAIGRAIKPLVDRQEADAQFQALKAAQEPSWQAAAAKYPQLQDPNGVLARAADQIWKSRPDLAGLPDAPLVVSTLAAAALAGTKEQKQQVVEGKQRASVTPVPLTARDKITGLLNENTGTEKMRENAAAVHDKIESTGVRSGEEGALRNMEAFRAQLTNIAADKLDAQE